MTVRWGPGDPSGLSGTGQQGAGPEPDELALLLRRVRDGLKRPSAESSSDEGDAAA